MAHVKLGDMPLNTNGEIPTTGNKAIDFSLINTDLKAASLSDFAGSRVILNIFPSIDTSTCAASVRQFNKIASELDNTQVVCISRDLPFAQKRFCGAEGIENVATLSDFDSGNFGKNYGLELVDGPLKGLHARAIIVINENQEIIHTELVEDIKDEPNYDAVVSVLK